jgi:DNA (cytosine-5)-methyltransferase 1
MWNEFYKNINIRRIGFPIWYDFFKQKPNDLYPDWKRKIIIKNNELYNSNKEFITSWEKKYDFLKWVIPTHRKFEWNCGDSISNVYEGLIQFRPSGVRIKKPNFFSTLVAINHPQYIGKLNRRLSANECKKLQSFPDEFQVHRDEHKALKQLGNAVNVKLVEIIINAVIHRLNFLELLYNSNSLHPHSLHQNSTEAILMDDKT